MEIAKRIIISAGVIFCLIITTAYSQEHASAGELYKQALAEEETGNYSRSKELYGLASQAFCEEGMDAMARESMIARQDLIIIEKEFSIKEDDLREELKKEFPDISAEEIEGWISSESLEHRVIDGEKMYFADIAANIKFRNPDLFRQDSAMFEGYKRGYEQLKTIIDLKDAKPWQPFCNPVSYRGKGRLNIPRDKLPETGLLQVWFPVPVLTGPQPSVRIISAEPSGFVSNPPSIDGDIGLVYMEIDLSQEKEDLDLRVEFSFDHYEQNFSVDPDNISPYDRESCLYREYTESRGNIAVTPEILQKAGNIIGEETNPWMSAKKIYDYCVSNIKYSYMPHLSMWPRGIPESVYVHENRHGDCGAQSIYFCALCRAVGIPARTTGGWQLFSGKFAGHFWAEFYLPGYGWIPVDPTAAEIVDYLPDVREEDRRAFHDYFFGNQDHFRCNVQKNVDIDLIPPPESRVLLPMAIQMPAVLCDTMDGIPGLELMEYWSLEAELVPQSHEDKPDQKGETINESIGY